MATREEYIGWLESAKKELQACMGGVNPEGADAACRKIRYFRSQLRDDPLMIAHLAACVKAPITLPHSKRARPASRKTG